MPKRIAICQPTYLPWLGYFDLMDQVDEFVLLDNVQFEKQSWQQRNRIKTPTGLQWLTVPVVFRGRLEQKICNVEIRDGDFMRKHLRAIELNYARAPFFPEHFSRLAQKLEESGGGTRLLDLNRRLLDWFREVLRVRTNTVMASALEVEGKRTQLLAEICQRLNATHYVSPIGSAEYLLTEMNILADAGVQTVFHNYTHPTYRQQFPPFVPFASVIDLIFNEGERSMEVIRSGRGADLSAAEVSARLAASKDA